MSHFTVTVIVPPGTTDIEEYLKKVLDRYDENREVEPYLDEDGGKTTYNPESKWDWWVVGGSWRGAYLPKADADLSRMYGGVPGVFDNEPKNYYDENGERRSRVDGGPVGMIDLEGMRQLEAKKAEMDWDQYQEIVAGTEELLPWSHFYDRAEGARNAMPKSRLQTILDAENVVNRLFGVPESIALDDIPPELNYRPGGEGDGPYWTERTAAMEALKAQPLIDGEGGIEPVAEEDDDPLAMFRAEDDKQWANTRYGAYKAQLKAAERAAGKQWDAEVSYSMDQARQDYHDQERVRKLRAAPCYKNMWDGPEDQFEGISREDCARRAADRAVPGYATITLNGEWIAPGKMGWFGMSTADDTSYEVYARQVNKMIDDLDPEAILIQLDCHI